MYHQYTHCIHFIISSYEDHSFFYFMFVWFSCLGRVEGGGGYKPARDSRFCSLEIENIWPSDVEHIPIHWADIWVISRSYVNYCAELNFSMWRTNNTCICEYTHHIQLLISNWGKIHKGLHKIIKHVYKAKESGSQAFILDLLPFSTYKWFLLHLKGPLPNNFLLIPLMSRLLLPSVPPLASLSLSLMLPLPCHPLMSLLPSLPLPLSPSPSPLFSYLPPSLHPHLSLPLISLSLSLSGLDMTQPRITFYRKCICRSCALWVASGKHAFSKLDQP